MSTDLFGNPHGLLTGQADLWEREDVVAPARRPDEPAPPVRAEAEKPRYPVFKWKPAPTKDRATLRIERQYTDTAATGRLKGI